MGYTQSPHLTEQEIGSLLETARIARFCSTNADGTIHAVPVWYRYLDGQIVIGTPVGSRKARNVRRNRNVTVLVDDSETRGVWPKGVIVYGRATMRPTALTLDEVARHCEKYFPPDEAREYACGLVSLTDWVQIVVEPVRIASFDYEKDRPYRDAVGD